MEDRIGAPRKRDGDCEGGGLGEKAPKALLSAPDRMVQKVYELRLKEISLSTVIVDLGRKRGNLG